jgi:hypothetical protein
VYYERGTSELYIDFRFPPKRRRKSSIFLSSGQSLSADLIFTFSFHICPDGVFGAMMEVSIANDGPVTITVDSKARNGSAGDQ